MAAYTATQSGNWSSSATWGGGGVPGDGDTATIGAFTVTVDVNTTVGTSPNDTTTKVVDKTSSTGALVVGSGVTFIVKGNIGGVNNSVFTMQDGSTLEFDASASGGTPAYRFINVGFQVFNFNGTSGNRCSVRSVAGRFYAISVAFASITATYTDFARASTFTSSNVTGNATFTGCTFDECSELRLASVGTTNSITIQGNRFTNGTHATNDIRIDYTGNRVSGTRLLSNNVLSKAIAYNSVGVDCIGNYIGNGVDNGVGRYWRQFRSNFVKGTRANGQVILAPSIYRNYFFADGIDGNPHFVEARASTDDVGFYQNVFESSEPDLIDYGDAILIVGSGVGAGRKIIGKNNLVLRNETGSVSTGTLVTFYNADANAITQWERNTANVDNTTANIYPRRSPFATAEANTGFAGQIEVLKSNLVWGSSSGQGYVAERLTGNVKDIITASGADYNWRHNTTTGDNQRSYEDQAAANTMWTAGDAVAAGVDANGASGDPKFLDSSRNLAKWCYVRGYGAQTNAAALTALQADPSRAADLVSYVFEGFKPSNASCRNAAHDGGCVGAANFDKSARDLTYVLDYRNSMSAWGI